MSSYPFRTGPGFARNQWYIAAWAAELGAAPLARTILGEEVVLYRGASGRAAAVASVCPHRWMPLAGAQVEGEAIVCPYHGARFEADGQCSRAPSQERVPPSFRLKAYPLVERGPVLWIWPGEPELADTALLPDAASVGLGEDGGWDVELVAPFQLAARAQLLIENLFDQSHVDFVHPSSLGGAVMHAKVREEDVLDEPGRFAVSRGLPLAEADDGARAVFEGMGGWFTARLRSELLGVSLVNSTGSQTFSADAADGELRLVGEMNFLHGVTPETATTTHYFTAATRNFARGNPGFTAALMERNAQVVREDVAILEAIETRIDQVGDARAEVSFASDVAAALVRRRMEKLIAAEQARRPPAAH